MAYELCFADETLDQLLDRMAEDANAVAPGLGRARAREILDRIFQARVTQTTACGRFAECTPEAPVWPTWKPSSGGVARPCAFHDPDPYDLPNVFAVACADALGPCERDAVEGRLAHVFRGALAEVLFDNRRCGHAAVCSAPSTDPFGRRRPT